MADWNIQQLGVVGLGAATAGWLNGRQYSKNALSPMGGSSISPGVLVGGAAIAAVALDVGSSDTQDLLVAFGAGAFGAEVSRYGYQQGAAQIGPTVSGRPGMQQQPVNPFATLIDKVKGFLNPFAGQQAPQGAQSFARMM